MAFLCTCASRPDPSANREERAIFCSLITGNLLSAVEALRRTSWVNPKWVGFMMCLPAFLPWYNTHTHTLRAALTWLTHSWLLLWLHTVAILFHVPRVPSARHSLALIRNVTYWMGSLLQIYVAQVLPLKLCRASISMQSYKHGLNHTQAIKSSDLGRKKKKAHH